MNLAFKHHRYGKWFGRKVSAGFELFLNSIDKPRTVGVLVKVTFFLNRLVSKNSEYKKYTLCRTMKSLDPVPFLPETYLVKDSMFAISKLNKNNEETDGYNFYLIDKDNSWNEATIEDLLADGPSSLKEEIIFNMDLL